MTNLVDRSVPAADDANEDDGNGGAATRDSFDGDLETLRRFAPVLVLDRRELFRPIAIDGYVRAATLVDRSGARFDDVTPDMLDDRWTAGTHLRLVDDADRRSLDRDELRSVRRRAASSRLGRVGLLGRLLDAMFQLSVWLRPTTPHRTTAAAARAVRTAGLDGGPVVYARRVRAGEWDVLHYAWFYAMNDWRSTYRGVNDHEADWEQAWIFRDPAGGRPVWVATTSHDRAGADVRRHWSDPEVTHVGDRVRLHVAAGSHGLFFRPGEYVTRIDVPGLRWVLRVQSWVRAVLRVRDDAALRGVGPSLGVPFVDSAGADGDLIDEWDVRPLAGERWCEQFRGLWGLDTGDPLQGERGPSGPKFDRSGEVRGSWADPLGFAGLHGTPPPSAVAARVNSEKLERAIGELDEQIRRRARKLPLAHQTESADEMAGESRRLTELLRQRTELDDLRERVAAGRWRVDGIRDHLRQPAVPIDAVPRSQPLLAAWAAISVPICLTALAAVLFLDRVRIDVVVLALFSVAVPLDLVVRRRFAASLRLVAVETALVAVTLTIAWTLPRAGAPVLGGLLVCGALVLLARNVSELGRAG